VQQQHEREAEELDGVRIPEATERERQRRLEEATRQQTYGLELLAEAASNTQSEDRGTNNHPNMFDDDERIMSIVVPLR
jgi:hypothetical protein